TIFSSLKIHSSPSTIDAFLFIVSELQEEGMNAINLPLSPTPFELDPEDTMLDESEVRAMVDPNSRNDPKLQEIMKVLIDWISDVLVGERIIVKDLAEDLYDGQVLQKLFENLEGEKLNVAEVTQCKVAQKQKLQTVLEKINDTLKISSRNTKWNVDSVHAKNIVAILHLLVALSQYFRAPIRLPDHVSIQVVVVQKREGILQSRQIQEEITGNIGYVFFINYKRSGALCAMGMQPQATQLQWHICWPCAGFDHCFRASTHLHGQHCDHCVHQPSSRSTLPSHVATLPPSPPLKSDADQITRHARMAVHIPWRMETPSPCGPADMKPIQGCSGRPVCLPRVLPLPALLLPDRGDPRHGHAGTQLAPGSMQVCISPSELPFTDPVQHQGA
uniref:Parvin alpha n=1 Tax=Sinocyclocheilus anshuiensis TaxID=1608454 RepID=A0A671PPU9_9TELE